MQLKLPLCFFFVMVMLSAYTHGFGWAKGDVGMIVLSAFTLIACLMVLVSLLQVVVALMTREKPVDPQDEHDEEKDTCQAK